MGESMTTPFAKLLCTKLDPAALHVLLDVNFLQQCHFPLDLQQFGVKLYPRSFTPSLKTGTTEFAASSTAAAGAKSSPHHGMKTQDELDEEVEAAEAEAEQTQVDADWAKKKEWRAIIDEENAEAEASCTCEDQKQNTQTHKASSL